MMIYNCASDSTEGVIRGGGCHLDLTMKVLLSLIMVIIAWSNVAGKPPVKCRSEQMKDELDTCVETATKYQTVVSWYIANLSRQYLRYF